MKAKYVFSLILAWLLSITTGCTMAQQTSALKPENILIVYLTRTNNTQAVARMIQKETGGRLIALELQNPYPQNYQAQVAQVVRENETGFLPPLKTRIDSIEKYDVVFIGFPTWSMEMLPPVKSFLSKYKFTGKTVIPFNTNAGYGVGNGFELVKQLCQGSKVLEGYSTKGGIERDGVLYVMEGQKEKQVKAEVKKWLQKIGMLK